MTASKTSEEAILAAARKVFGIRGREGARMQEIADEAGINKALLHYYFRSKEKLFEIVFQEAFSKFARNVNELLRSEASFDQKIDSFIENYITLLIDNPYLPGFVIGEIGSNPERLLDFISSRGILLDSFQEQVSEEYQKGNIRKIDGKHLFVNIIALCVFPIIGRPILKGLFFSNDNSAFDTFLLTRQEEVKRFIHSSLRPDIQNDDL
ncbi:MAG: TetR/AcrR family transcriptional regulator [Bacteroidota bacterium]